MNKRFVCFLVAVVMLFAVTAHGNSLTEGLFEETQNTEATEIPPVQEGEISIDELRALINQNADDIAQRLALTSKDIPVLASGTDFDTLFTGGSYRVSSVSYGETMINAPTTAGGRLIVMESLGASRMFQIYLANTSGGDIFVRRYTSSGWTPWKTVAYEEDIEAAISEAVSNLSVPKEVCTELAEGTDLDSIKASGAYRVPTMAKAKTMINCPVAKGGKLTVTETINRGRLVQTYLANSQESLVYIRSFNGSVWSGWKQVAYTQDIEAVVAEAIKKLEIKDEGAVRFDSAQELTEEQKAQVKENLGIKEEGVVRFDSAQELTDEQKAQARENIGVTEELSKAILNKGTTYTFADMNDAEDNTICYTSPSRVVDNYPPNVGAAYVATISLGTQNKLQVVFDAYGTTQLSRACVKGTWGEWSETNATTEKNGDVPTSTIALFEKVGCCGDSFTAGYLYNKETSDTYDENYVANGEYTAIGYPAVMERLYGVETTSFAKAGLTSGEWRTDSKGLPALLEAEPQDLYIIALGLNDKTNGVPIGEVTDIDNEPTTETALGNYGAIIRAIKNHAPQSKIVLVKSMWVHSEGSTTPNGYYDYVNEVVTTVSEHLKIPFIETLNDSYFCSEEYVNGFKGFHPTAPLYAGMGKRLGELIGECIINNPEYFFDFYIPNDRIQEQPEIGNSESTATDATAALIYEDINGSDATAALRYYEASGGINPDGTWTTLNNRTHVCLPVNGGEAVSLKVGKNEVIYAFLTTNEVRDGQVAEFCEGYGTRTKLAAGAESSFVVPAECNYLYMYAIDHIGRNCLPVSLVIDGVERVSNIRESISTLSKEVEQINDSDDLTIPYEDYLINTICIGDSLTAGAYYVGNDVGAPIAENYPYFLQRRTNLTVTSHGICGIKPSTMWKGRTSADREFMNYVGIANDKELDFSEYDSAIVWLGTNGGLTDTYDTDVKPFDNPEDFAKTQMGYYCRILERMIEQSPNIRIFLVGIYAGGSGDVNTTNMAIQSIAEAYSDNVVCVIDTQSLKSTGKTDPLHPDNVLHFGKAGNLVVADHILMGMRKGIQNRLGMFENILIQ